MPGRFIEIRTSMEIFDSISETWSVAPDMPNPHWGHRAVVLGGWVYVIGGGSDIVEVLDPIAGVWQTVAPLPESLSGFVAETDGILIYVMGGYAGVRTGKVWIYDPVADSWSSGPPMVKQGDYLDSAIIGQQIFVLGEFGGDSRRMFLFDTPTLTWTEGTRKRRGYRQVGVTVAGGLLYAIGGRGG